jgi:hypothetical protein
LRKLARRRQNVNDDRLHCPLRFEKFGELRRSASPSGYADAGQPMNMVTMFYHHQPRPRQDEYDTEFFLPNDVFIEVHFHTSDAGAICSARQ